MLWPLRHRDFPKEVTHERKLRLYRPVSQVQPIDMNKLNAFIGQFVGDLGAAVHAGMVVIGEKLGLYKALAAGSDDPCPTGCPHRDR